MNDRFLNQITVHIAVFGAVIALGALLLGGVDRGVGALVGAGVAVLNILAMRWVVGKVAKGSDRQKAGFMVLLALKMGALMLLCWVLIAKLGVDPIGFVAGISSLVLGGVTGSFIANAHAHADEDADATTGSVAEEEG